MNRAACVLCGSGSLDEVIDLGLHPFADTFVPEERLDVPDTAYPLVVDRCGTCGQVQSRALTHPIDRYDGLTPYAYTAANSPTSRAHWIAFAHAMIQEAGLAPNDAVLEIGANDGFLLAQFSALGYRVLGVDASQSLCDLAETARGVPTLHALWGMELHSADHVLQHFEGDRPQLVIANNVLNHANHPVAFAKAVADVLAPDGLFVWEVPDWRVLVQQAAFDQIYHEHVTYWTPRTALQLMQAVGLQVLAIQEVDYHGGSIRVLACRPSTARTGISVAPGEPMRWDTLQDRVRQDRTEFLRNFYTMVDRDPDPVVCIGAAAKANTFLTYYGLNRTTIHCVTDASTRKIGTYTPGTRIPIRSDAELTLLDHPYAIVTAWNLTTALRTKLAGLNAHITYLTRREGVRA